MAELSAQAAFWQSSARHPALIGGRGSGKSVASLMKAIRFVNEHPGANGIHTVPINDQVDKILLPSMRKFYGPAEGQDWVWQEKKSKLVFPGLRSQIFVRPALEYDSLRGPDYAFFSMDEVGTGDQMTAFYILQPTLRQTGYPHQGWVTTTPSTQRWVKTLWEDHVDPMSEQPLRDPEQYVLFNAKSWDNLHLPEWQREKMKAEAEVSRWARQEYGGEFLSLEGLAFPDLDAATHRRTAGTDWGPRESVGFDFGASSATSLIHWKLDLSGRPWAVDEFYKRGATEYDWVTWLADRQLYTVTCDPSISDKQIIDWRQRYGIYMRRASPSIRTFPGRYAIWSGMLAVKPDGLPGGFITPNCPNLWNELTNLAFHTSRVGGVETDRWATGVQDHAYDAGAYGLSALTQVMGRPHAPFIPGELVLR